MPAKKVAKRKPIKKRKTVSRAAHKVTRQTSKRKTAKTTKRTSRNPLTKKKTQRSVVTKKRSPQKKTVADFKLDAIKRDASAQLIVNVLLELGINHHEMHCDDHFMRIHLSPKDAVTFYALIVRIMTKPFKESIASSYKTNGTDLVTLFIPVIVMDEVAKLLCNELSALP